MASRQVQSRVVDGHGHEAVLGAKLEPGRQGPGRGRLHRENDEAVGLHGQRGGCGEAHRRKRAVDVQLKHQAELAEVSSQINKQELRKFYFSAFSVLVLAAILSLLFFQSPRGRDWLPQETDTILSINADQFERANLAKRWRDAKPKLWPGLIGPAASVPGLNPSRDTARITHALTTDETGETKEFNLVQSRRGLAHLGVLKALHFAPKAKRVIYLFMSGGPSHIDLFDYKPKLRELHGTELPATVRMGQRITGMTSGQVHGTSLDFANAPHLGARYSSPGVEIAGYDTMVFELKVTDAELETPQQVDRAARQIQAPELVAFRDQRAVTLDARVGQAEPRSLTNAEDGADERVSGPTTAAGEGAPTASLDDWSALG